MNDQYLHTLQDLIQQLPRHTALWQDGKVHVAPHIPVDKLYGSIGSYGGHAVKPDDVLLLVDDTVFGGAKEGLLITAQAIYCKEAFEPAQAYRFSDMVEISHKGQFLSNSISINGRKVIGLTQPDKQSMAELVHLLSRYLVQMKAQSAPSQADAQSHHAGQTPYSPHSRSGQASQNHSHADEVDVLLAAADVQVLAPVIDILCHFALMREGYWNAPTLQYLQQTLSGYFNTESKQLFLQQRLMQTSRPSLTQAAAKIMQQIGHDERLKTRLLLWVCEVIYISHQDIPKQQMNPAIRESLYELGLQLGMSWTDIIARMEAIDRQRQHKAAATQSRNQHTGQRQQQHTHHQQRTHQNASPRAAQTNPQLESACQVLGISVSGLSLATVQQAYRRQMSECHPDRYHDLPESIRQMLHDKAQQLNHARDLLLNHLQP